MADEPANTPEEQTAPAQPEQEAPADTTDETATTTTNEPAPAPKTTARKGAVGKKTDSSPVLGDTDFDPLQHGKETAARNS